MVASGTTGATSSISFATGTAAYAFGLSEEGGAVLNNATVTDTPGNRNGARDRLHVKLCPNSALGESAFDVDWWKSLATWVSKQNHRYWTIQWGKEPTALIANNDVCFGAWLEANVIADCTPIYGDQIPCSLCMWFWDFD